MTFSQWVKDTRESKKLSQSECARRLGIKQPSWQVYEKEGKQQPNKETVKRIAFALEVREDEALAAAGYASNQSSVDVPPELVGAWLRVPVAKRQAFLRNMQQAAELAAL